MIKLPKDRYIELYSVVDPLLDNVEVKAILKQQSDGAIFVRDTDNLASFLLYSFALNGFYILGRSEGFLEEVKEFFYSGSESFLDLGIDWVEFSCEHRDVMDEATLLFDDIDRELTYQYVYKYIGATKPKQPTLVDSSYRVVNLLDLEDSIDQYKLLKERIETFWTSIDQFFREGFGYSIMKADEVASLCLAAFITDRYSALEIETFKGFQNNGLAKIVASKVVSEAVDRGLIPYWDCMGENIPSQKTAEAIGFKKSCEYRLLGLYVGFST